MTKFANWPPEIHETELQRKRMASAASAALTPLDIDYETGTATFSGHHGIYQTTLSSCSCGDFCSKHLPCKHIYRLAHQMYHIDLGHTVMYNADDVVNPDDVDRVDKAMRIGEVIDNQPSDSYISILAVLRTIKTLGRPISTINSAIQYLESKVEITDIDSDTVSDTIQFAGMTYVLAGEFSSFSRNDAKEWLEARGATVSNTITKKTNFLVFGGDGLDGKLRRAQAMGIPVLTEDEFLKLFKRNS